MKNLFKALVAVCAISLTTGVSAAIIADGKEWRQVTETVNFSWNDFNSVCSTSDGSCSGSLTNGTVGTVSFDGWTWASQGDVASLFRSLDGWDGPTATDSFFHTSVNSTWAPNSFDDLGFLPTWVPSSARYTLGLSRSLFGSSWAVEARLSDAPSNLDSDTAGTTNGVPLGTTNIIRGGWFYKDATSAPSVPAPPTLALLLVPGLMMVAFRKPLTA